MQPDYDHFEKSFILKTRRIEYTFNHFRVKEKENVPQSLKEISDEMFVDEMVKARAAKKDAVAA